MDKNRGVVLPLQSLSPENRAYTHTYITHYHTCGKPQEAAGPRPSPSVQARCALVEEHLALLQRHRVQLSVVVLDLDGPGLGVVVVLVGDVHDGRDHVREQLVVSGRQSACRCIHCIR